MDHAKSLSLLNFLAGRSHGAAPSPRRSPAVTAPPAIVDGIELNIPPLGGPRSMISPPLPRLRSRLSFPLCSGYLWL
jgi:hypothetical protein